MYENNSIEIFNHKNVICVETLTCFHYLVFNQSFIFYFSFQINKSFLLYFQYIFHCGISNGTSRANLQNISQYSQSPS